MTKWAHRKGNLVAWRTTREWARAALLAILVAPAARAVLSPATLEAQDSTRRMTPRWEESGAGAELERYLRAMQLGGEVPVRGWSLRAFSLSELAAMRPDGANAWGKRFTSAPKTGWWVVRPSAELIANSGFPWGINDGPTWAGKGITTVATGGGSMR